MTTSLNPRQPPHSSSISTRSHDNALRALCEKEPGPLRHACEIQRMKDFAGQRRFQAPVADDFARGMLAPGQSLKTETHPLAQIRGALASVILGLRALCAGQKLD